MKRGLIVFAVVLAIVTACVFAFRDFQLLEFVKRMHG